jgi:hypothetical protein
MPFNDKGEFIRSTNPAAASTAARQCERKSLVTLENLFFISMAIGLIVLFAGAIWLLVRYWELVLMAAVGYSLIRIRLWRQ